MTPKGFPDPEYPADLSAQGQRKDNRSLIDEWLSMKEGKVKREREAEERSQHFDFIL